MSRASGFSLAEVLVATAIVLILSAALLLIVLPSHATSRVQPALMDQQQRLRAAVEAIGGDLRAAGSGPVTPLTGLPLGGVVPAVFPYRVGLWHPDPPGSFLTDSITIVGAAAAAPAPTIRNEFSGEAGTLPLNVVPGCPVGRPACGLAEGETVLLVDSSGQWDIFGVAGVVNDTVTVQPRGLASGRRYAAGSRLVPVAVSAYYLRPPEGLDGPVLARYDGNQSDLPLVDHLVSVRFEYYGDPRPPRPRTAPGPRGESMTYGPAPPLLDEDDPRDAWGAGENCVVTLDAGRQVPRLPALAADDAPLRRLEAAALTDGPWCPDAAAANRFDADLLRVRKVRVSLRAEASDEGLRGPDRRLFARPGRSSRGVMLVPDREVTFDVVPRALAGGR